MDTLTDRLVMWALRAVATAMLFAGVSALVAGVPLLGMLPESPVARSIAGILFQLIAVFVVSGATAIYLSRPRAQGLPNERATTSDAGRPGIGGWLIALAIVLAALPVWLMLRLQPFLAEWRRVIDFLAASDIWQGANANMSGVVLVPLAGALTPPMTNPCGFHSAFSQPSSTLSRRSCDAIENNARWPAASRVHALMPS